MLKILLFACLLGVFNAEARSAFSGTVTHVTDGDTLWVQPEFGGPVRKLRIDGIDAPEICQAGGLASREVLARYVLHQQVLVSIRRQDVYGRGLARIQFKGQDLGAQMVRSGQAWSYRWHQSLGPYAAEEEAARQSRLGLFAASRFELPRTFRKQHGSCYAPEP